MTTSDAVQGEAPLRTDDIAKPPAEPSTNTPAETRTGRTPEQQRLIVATRRMLTRLGRPIPPELAPKASEPKAKPDPAPKQRRRRRRTRRDLSPELAAARRRHRNHAPQSLDDVARPTTTQHDEADIPAYVALDLPQRQMLEAVRVLLSRQRVGRLTTEQALDYCIGSVCRKLLPSEGGTVAEIDLLPKDDCG
jgi:hypothetical protein